jgi:ABC-type glycerol-3-phosphate transport system permease component
VGRSWRPATLAIVPALLAYVVAQRYILESFVAAGLKG